MAAEFQANMRDRRSGAHSMVSIITVPKREGLTLGGALGDLITMHLNIPWE